MRTLVQVRLADDEKAAWETEAATEGLTVSAWLRWLATRRLAERSGTVLAPVPAAPEPPKQAPLEKAPRVKKAVVPEPTLTRTLERLLPKAPPTERAATLPDHLRPLWAQKGRRAPKAEEAE